MEREEEGDVLVTGKDYCGRVRAPEGVTPGPPRRKLPHHHHYYLPEDSLTFSLSYSRSHQLTLALFLSLTRSFPSRRQIMGRKVEEAVVFNAGTKSLFDCVVKQKRQPGCVR